MTKLILGALVASLSFSAAAAEKLKFQEVDETKIRELNSDSMESGTFYYYHTKNIDPVIEKVDGAEVETFSPPEADRPMAFETWKTKHPVDVEYLTLFNNYIEPSFPRRVGDRPLEEKITMFVAKAKAIVNKSPRDVEISKLIDKEFIVGIDSSVIHNQISADETMPALTSSGQLSQRDPFKFCNEGLWLNHITRHLREVDLQVLQRPGEPWCSGTNSKCYSSCSLFDNSWVAVVKSANMKESADTAMDSGISMQTEFRYFKKEQDMKKQAKISQLTSIDTPVVGVLEGNTFFFNQVVQFAKVLAVVQEHPTNPKMTIVSTFFTVGLRSRSYRKSAMGILVSDVIMGREGVNEGRKGFAAGLPKFTAVQMRNLTKQIGN